MRWRGKASGQRYYRRRRRRPWKLRRCDGEKKGHQRNATVATGDGGGGCCRSCVRAVMAKKRGIRATLLLPLATAAPLGAAAVRRRENRQRSNATIATDVFVQQPSPTKNEIRAGYIYIHVSAAVGGGDGVPPEESIACSRTFARESFNLRRGSTFGSRLIIGVGP